MCAFVMSAVGPPETQGHHCMTFLRLLDSNKGLRGHALLHGLRFVAHETQPAPSVNVQHTC